MECPFLFFMRVCFETRDFVYLILEIESLHDQSQKKKKRRLIGFTNSIPSVDPLSFGFQPPTNAPRKSPPFYLFFTPHIILQGLVGCSANKGESLQENSAPCLINKVPLGCLPCVKVPRE